MLVLCVDFPYVPYTRLPELRRIAHEFYDPLPVHTSFVKLIWDFIWMDQLGPQSRSVACECTSKPVLYEGMPSTIDFYATTSASASLGGALSIPSAASSGAHPGATRVHSNSQNME